MSLYVPRELATLFKLPSTGREKSISCETPRLGQFHRHRATIAGIADQSLVVFGGVVPLYALISVTNTTNLPLCSSLKRYASSLKSPLTVLVTMSSPP